MKRVGLTSLATSVALIGLLAGCSSQHDGQPHGLTAESRLRVADAAEISGDRQTAVAMFAAAATDSPNDTPIQLRSAEGLARNGNLEDASALLTGRLKATPHDADLQRTLGAIQVMAGEPARAVLTLSDVLAARPNDLKALVNKAVALDLLHKHDEAQELYRKALAEVPNDITTNNDLALSLLLSGRREEARLAMLPFRDGRNLPERVRTNLGILDAATGHPAEARQVLSARIEPGDLASLTQAISVRGSGFQPDAGRRIVARGALTEPLATQADPVVVRVEPAAVRAAVRPVPASVSGVPLATRVDPAVVLTEPAVMRQEPAPVSGMPPVAAHADPVMRREEPVAGNRPLQEQRPVRADPGVAHAETVVSRAALPEQPVMVAQPVPPATVTSVPPVAPTPVPRTPPVVVATETTTQRSVAVDSHGPLQDDLVPRTVRAAHVEATAVPRSLVQEPLAAPDMPPPSSRPLQEAVARAPEPVVQHAQPPAPARPLQEQATGAATVANGAPR